MLIHIIYRHGNISKVKSLCENEVRKYDSLYIDLEDKKDFVNIILNIHGSEPCQKCFSHPKGQLFFLAIQGV